MPTPTIKDYKLHRSFNTKLPQIRSGVTLKHRLAAWKGQAQEREDMAAFHRGGSIAKQFDGGQPSGVFNAKQYNSLLKFNVLKSTLRSGYSEVHSDQERTHVPDAFQQLYDGDYNAWEALEAGQLDVVDRHIAEAEAVMTAMDSRELIEPEEEEERGTTTGLNGKGKGRPQDQRKHGKGGRGGKMYDAEEEMIAVYGDGGGLGLKGGPPLAPQEFELNHEVGSDTLHAAHCRAEQAHHEALRAEWDIQQIHDMVGRIGGKGGKGGKGEFEHQIHEMVAGKGGKGRHAYKHYHEGPGNMALVHFGHKLGNLDSEDIDIAHPPMYNNNGDIDPVAYWIAMNTAHTGSPITPKVSSPQEAFTGGESPLAMASDEMQKALEDSKRDLVVALHEKAAAMTETATMIKRVRSAESLTRKTLKQLEVQSIEHQAQCDDYSRRIVGLQAEHENMEARLSAEWSFEAEWKKREEGLLKTWKTSLEKQEEKTKLRHDRQQACTNRILNRVIKRMRQYQTHAALRKWIQNVMRYQQRQEEKLSALEAKINRRKALSGAIDLIRRTLTRIRNGQILCCIRNWRERFQMHTLTRQGTVSAKRKAQLARLESRVLEEAAETKIQDAMVEILSLRENLKTKDSQLKVFESEMPQCKLQVRRLKYELASAEAELTISSQFDWKSNVSINSPPGTPPSPIQPQIDALHGSQKINNVLTPPVSDLPEGVDKLVIQLTNEIQILKVTIVKKDEELRNHQLEQEVSLMQNAAPDKKTLSNKIEILQETIIKKNEELRRQATKLDSMMESTTKTRNNSSALISLRVQLESKEAEIESLRALLLKQEHTTERILAENKKKVSSSEASTMKILIRDKDAEIRRLEEIIAHHKRETHQTAVNQISVQVTEINQLHADIQNKTDENERLRAVIYRLKKDIQKIKITSTRDTETLLRAGQDARSITPVRSIRPELEERLREVEVKLSSETREKVEWKRRCQEAEKLALAGAAEAREARTEMVTGKKTYAELIETKTEVMEEIARESKRRQQEASMRSAVNMFIRNQLNLKMRIMRHFQDNYKRHMFTKRVTKKISQYAAVKLLAKAINLFQIRDMAICIVSWRDTYTEELVVSRVIQYKDEKLEVMRVSLIKEERMSTLKTVKMSDSARRLMNLTLVRWMMRDVHVALKSWFWKYWNEEEDNLKRSNTQHGQRIIGTCRTSLTRSQEAEHPPMQRLHRQARSEHDSVQYSHGYFSSTVERETTHDASGVDPLAMLRASRMAFKAVLRGHGGATIDTRHSQLPPAERPTTTSYGISTISVCSTD